MRRQHSTLFLTTDPDKPASPEAKLELIRRRIEGLVQNRMALLHQEATTLAADMDVLTHRIENDGHSAQVDDMRAGRWYRTASDLRLLQNLYRYVSEVMGTREFPIQLPSEDDGVPIESKDFDEVVDD